MAQTMRTDFDCDECGKSKMVFYLEDQDVYGVYGTLVCPRCGYEEIYEEDHGIERMKSEGVFYG